MRYNKETMNLQKATNKRTKAKYDENLNDPMPSLSVNNVPTSPQNKDAEVHPDFLKHTKAYKNKQKALIHKMCCLLVVFGCLTAGTVVTVFLPRSLSLYTGKGEEGDWSMCDQTCGSGHRHRNRSCSTADCLVNLTGTKPCPTLPPCPSFWSSWTLWGSCDKLCGTGKETRTRNCTIGDGSVEGCKGISRDTKPCNTHLICHDCSSVGTSTGVYKLKVKDIDEFDAYCDQGWTTIMSRFDGSQDFYLSWIDYKYGFGNKTGEHWLGNEYIYHLTNQGNYSLRLNFKLCRSIETHVAEYSYFRIESETNNYRLSVSGVSGDIWNVLGVHNNQYFTTNDRDNDCRYDANCAKIREGGFWHKACGSTLLTSPYKCSQDKPRHCMSWYPNGYWQCLSAFSMNIKPQ